MSENLSGTGALRRPKRTPEFHRDLKERGSVARVAAWSRRMRDAYAGRKFNVTSPPADGGKGRRWPASLPRQVRRALGSGVSFDGRDRADMKLRTARRMVASIGAHCRAGGVLFTEACGDVLKAYRVPGPWFIRQLRRGAA